MEISFSFPWLRPLTALTMKQWTPVRLRLYHVYYTTGPPSPEMPKKSFWQVMVTNFSTICTWRSRMVMGVMGLIRSFSEGDSGVCILTPLGFRIRILHLLGACGSQIQVLKGSERSTIITLGIWEDKGSGVEIRKTTTKVNISCFDRASGCEIMWAFLSYLCLWKIVCLWKFLNLRAPDLEPGFSLAPGYDHVIWSWLPILHMWKLRPEVLVQLSKVTQQDDRLYGVGAISNQEHSWIGLKGMLVTTGRWFQM